MVSYAKGKKAKAYLIGVVRKDITRPGATEDSTIIEKNVEIPFYFHTTQDVVNTFKLEDRVEAASKKQLFGKARKEHDAYYQIADGTEKKITRQASDVGQQKKPTKGSKTVQLVLGKLTRKKNHRRISFRFPGILTYAQIAEALAETFAEKNAIKASPADQFDQIFPYMITESGARYILPDPVVAEQRKTLDVAASAADVAAMQARLDGDAPV